MSTAVSIETFGDPSNGESFDLVEMLLSEQHDLTAVEQFSEADERTRFEEPSQAKYYRSLLPATPPGPGQQYAFRVDLDACSGCKACVVACHNLNGLEDDETWRRVGTLTVGGDQPILQHVTTACHHCENPGCLAGCPVKAYDKDPVTGIVVHLDDQCIGCKYCTMMCPYEVPQYSKRLGIVRKCDMCHQRLRVGEAPACVQACPNEAIAISVEDTDTCDFEPNDRLVAGAPPSRITRPTTLYESTRNASCLQPNPQDAGIDQPAEDHWPLAAMLVATQASVGILLFERTGALVSALAGWSWPLLVTQISAVSALLVAAVGMNLAPLHLGQPLRAWRVFLGLRTSWLSREAVVLGKYMGLLAVATGLLLLPLVRSFVPESITALIPGWAAPVTLGVAIGVGLVGLYCSAMIYIATQRRLWRRSRTAIRFFGSGLVTGSAFAAAAMQFGQAPSAVTWACVLICVLLALLKLGWEWRVHLGPPQSADESFDARSRKLVRTSLNPLRKARIMLAFLSLSIIVPAAFWTLASSPAPSGVLLTVAATCLLAADYFERLLYFSSVVYERMPGVLK